MMLLRNF